MTALSPRWRQWGGMVGTAGGYFCSWGKRDCPPPPHSPLLCMSKIIRQEKNSPTSFPLLLPSHLFLSVCPCACMSVCARPPLQTNANSCNGLMLILAAASKLISGCYLETLDPVASNVSQITQSFSKLSFDYYLQTFQYLITQHSSGSC